METVRGWVEQTPEDFVFAIKASRYMTHVKRLREPKKGGVERFFDTLDPLLDAGKLGPILWQLPESFTRDDARLSEALDRVPSGDRHAFEFRHASWFVPEVYELLRAHGVALVVSDHPKWPFQTRELTAGWTYVRLHHGRRGRNGNYSEAELDTWRRRMAAWRSRAEVYAYLNNEVKAHTLRNARRLATAFA